MRGGRPGRCLSAGSPAQRFGAGAVRVRAGPGREVNRLRRHLRSRRAAAQRMLGRRRSLSCVGQLLSFPSPSSSAILPSLLPGLLASLVPRTLPAHLLEHRHDTHRSGPAGPRAQGGGPPCRRGGSGSAGRRRCSRGRAGSGGEPDPAAAAGLRSRHTGRWRPQRCGEEAVRGIDHERGEEQDVTRSIMLLSPITRTMRTRLTCVRTPAAQHRPPSLCTRCTSCPRLLLP